MGKTVRLADRVGVPHAFGSISEALRLPNVDAVIIASPPATHAPFALEAIMAGCHVLVEKPFTLNAAEARELHEAAEAAGVVGLVGHEFRFDPQRAAVTRALAQGVIGSARLATLIWHMSFVAPLDARRPEWWFDRARGGGLLNASVPHFADAVRLWFGDVAVVNASLPMVSDRDPSQLAEDSLVIRFRTVSGCEGLIQQSAAVWGEEFQVMRIAGSTGTIVAERGSVSLATADGRRELDIDEPAVTVERSEDPHHPYTHLELGPAVRQAQAFCRLIGGGNIEDEPLPPATFADGVASIAFLDAARISAASDAAPVAVG
jgi:predicted dehydrogenase